MATFAVGFDGTRVVDASSTTGWTAEGTTPTAEPDFFYQGTGSISAKVKTTEAGFYYTSSSQNLSTNVGVWIAKILATTKDSLDGNGLLVRIGSATTAYYEYRKFSSTTYPIAGGWQILCIDPNISQWRDATSGSPNLSAVIYWAIRADFSATAKSENVAMDAIDWIPSGKGLTCSDGFSVAAGTWANILTADEGTANNRWGIVSSKSGILYVNGTITFGDGGTGVTFSDSLQTIVFPSQYVSTGFCGLFFDLTNSNTIIIMTQCVFRGRGALSGSDDTRPDYTVSGTTSSSGINLTGCQFNVYRLITFNSKVTALNCTFISGGAAIIADNADLRGSSLSGFTGAADSSALRWNSSSNPNGKLDNMTFTKGSTATHAIAFGTASATTIGLTGITFSGYNASDGQNDSMLYFEDRGSDTTWTINVSGGTTPSYKKARAGDTVNVVSTVTVTFTGMKDNSEVRIYDHDTGVEIDGIENATSGTTDNRSFAWSDTVGNSVDYVIHNLNYETIRVNSFIVPSVSSSIPIQQRIDRNYSNP